MDKKGLLIIMIVITLSLSHMVQGEDDLGSTITRACTVATDTNCLDVHCKIVGDNNEIISGNEFDGEKYVRSDTIQLRDSQYNFTVKDKTDLEGLAVTCTIPEFNTKYCTYRGIWATSVDVDRRYIPKEQTTSVSTEPFTLKPTRAFFCDDYIPPSIIVLEDEPNYETGGRTIRFLVSDDERALASNDKTNISFCAYKMQDPGQSLPTTKLTLSEENNPPSDWTRIDGCNNTMRTDAIDENPDNSSKDFIVYAIDTSGNFVYHRIEGKPLYRSLPLDSSNHFCPRPNECFISTNGDIDNNTFEDIYEGGDTLPICVVPGTTLNDVYCDASRGLMSKTERIYEIVRDQSSSFSSANITIYCSDMGRVATLLSNSIPAKCSFDYNTKEDDCMNSCTLYVQTGGAKTAFLYTSVNRPASLTLPGILPTTIIQGPSCNAVISPYSYLTCPYNFRGRQSLFSYYNNQQSLLHVGTQSSGTQKNLSLSTASQLHDEPLMVRLRDAIADYYYTERTYSNEDINNSVFEGSRGAYEYIAYRKNGDRTALAMRIDLDRAIHATTLTNNRMIVAAIYHNYNGADIDSFVKSTVNPNIYPLRLIRVYQDGAYTVVVGSVSDDVEAAKAIEQLVVRIRPGGLS